MGAVHFLSHEFSLPDARTQGVRHVLELYEHGGQRYLRLWINGIASDMPVVCSLTKAQAEEISEGAQRLATRIVE